MKQDLYVVYSPRWWSVHARIPMKQKTRADYVTLFQSSVRQDKIRDEESKWRHW